MYDSRTWYGRKDPETVSVYRSCFRHSQSVQISGNDQILTIISNKYGNTIFKNNTSITASEGNNAFSVFYGESAQFDDPGVFVTIEDETVDITGKLEFGKADRATPYNFKMKAGVTAPEDMSFDVSLLTIPCEWINNGDNTKTLKYTGI